MADGRRRWWQRDDHAEQRRAALLWAGLAALIGLAMLWWQVPSFYGSRVEGRAGAIATTRTGVLTVAAGLIAFIGVTLNLTETRRANRDTERREWLAASTDRYSKAIEQLGSDKSSIRLGGVHLLERLGAEISQDQPTVVGVLSDFVVEQADPLVRLRAAEPGNKALTAPASEQRQLAAEALADRPLPADVQAALAVFSRLPGIVGVPRAELAGAYLPTARLAKANLTGADLSGANLTGADLGRANLTGADLGRADLTGVNLGVVNLTGVNLSGADLTGVNLSGADLTGADLGAADLTGADLDRANLINANLGMTDLTGTNLSRANLTGADLSWANLTGADLSWANLTEANLSRANLTHANLGMADLTGTNLGWATLIDANLDRANLTGANLDGADLGEVRGLHQGALDSAMGDALTRLPERLQWRPSWASDPGTAPSR